MSKQDEYILFRNDGKQAMVAEGERWYFLLDQETMRAKYLIKVDDCGEGSAIWRKWMSLNGLTWRRFGEKKKDKSHLEVWWLWHHRMAWGADAENRRQRDFDLVRACEFGSPESLAFSTYQQLVTPQTIVVDLRQMRDRG
jgi:hypothetical protein